MALMSGEEARKEKWPLIEKGKLLEFKKKGSHSYTKLLVVAETPYGNNKWIVSDENGESFPINLNRVRYVVPGTHHFDPLNITEFAKKAKDKLDITLLELAWTKLLQENIKPLTKEELAQIIFGSAEPLHCYSAHLLLSKDELYFTRLNSSYYCSTYQPRSLQEIEEIKCRKVEKEAEEKEFMKFIELVKSVKSMPSEKKPPKSSWMVEPKIQSLEAFANESTQLVDQQTKKIAKDILKAMDMKESSYSAVNLLKDIGYLPLHFNAQLVSKEIPTLHSQETISAANLLLSHTSDPDQKIRKDLTHLQTYAIDVNEACELDDALSVIRLNNGGFQVWIHIADPTIYVQPGSLIDREAMRRWTSVFLPTATYSMFPEELAMQGMSMKQGHICNTITVSVVLNNDGSIAACSVENTTIKLTQTMTYDEATKLLQSNHQDNDNDDINLKIMSEAASLRLKWRVEHGALDATTTEALVRVAMASPEDTEPEIKLYLDNQTSLGTRIVSEMMILCGEAIGNIGSYNRIPLPYRGQVRVKVASEFANLPEGPDRRMFVTSGMEPAYVSYHSPQHHHALGLSAYVQFSSPIRRYSDLLAHYQIKAFMRGESLPFGAEELEEIVRREKGEEKMKIAKTLTRKIQRYWLLEYIRRQPKKTYNALILRVFENYKAVIMLREVAMEASVRVCSEFRKGNEIEVEVEEVNPRDNLLLLKLIKKL